jgi:hypothetical protein
VAKNDRISRWDVRRKILASLNAVDEITDPVMITILSDQIGASV